MFALYKGARVTIDVRYSPMMDRQYMNAIFTPTAAFKGTTTGICGLFDNDDANDMTGPDGTVYTDSTQFVESCKVFILYFIICP